MKKDAETRGCGDEGMRRRGDAGTRGFILKIDTHMKLNTKPRSLRVSPRRRVAVSPRHLSASPRRRVSASPLSASPRPLSPRPRVLLLHPSSFILLNPFHIRSPNVFVQLQLQTYRQPAVNDPISELLKLDFTPDG